MVHIQKAMSVSNDLYVFSSSGYKVLGTKRLASEDLVRDWDNKRLNAGQVSNKVPEQVK